MDQYNDTIRENIATVIPWYNKAIHTGMRHRRYCERHWAGTGLFGHFEIKMFTDLYVKELLATVLSVITI